MAERRWRTVEEAAERAHVHPITVRRAVRQGRLKAVRVNGGRSIRLLDEWVDVWLMSSSDTAPSESEISR